MASLKIVLCIALFAAVALGNVVPNTRREHNIDLCLKPPTDGKQWTPYYGTAVEVPGKILQIVTKEIKWPTDGMVRDKIKCVRVTDTLGDGTGGYPTIHEGGLNYDHLTIHLESQRNHGMKFNIQVMGEPEIDN